MDYMIAFAEGFITFISPCMLPMLPLYLTYFAGNESGSSRRTLKNAIGFVLGFSIIFIAMGAFAGTLGAFLSNYHTLISILGGILIILFGLNFLGILHISLFDKNGASFEHTNMGFFSSMLFGIVFSVSWTPCISAFLGSALLMASTEGSALKGTILLLLYSLGLGIPFILSALFINRLKNTFQFIKNHYTIINKIAGILLLCVGIYMTASGIMNYQPSNTNNQTIPSVTEAEKAHEEQGSTNTNASENSEEAAKVIPAPDFAVVDATGNEVTLSSLFGKPIVLNFWASWCPPCKSEMPDFNEVYKELGDEVTFVMVDMTDGMRETQEQASAFIEEQGFSFPVYYDINQEAANSYRVYSLPTTYFIDKNGTVVTGAQGAINKELLEKGISMIVE